MRSILCDPALAKSEAAVLGWGGYFGGRGKGRVWLQEQAPACSCVCVGSLALPEIASFWCSGAGVLRGVVGCAESPRPQQPSLGAPSPHLGGLGPCWGSLFRAALTVTCPRARSPAGNPPNAPVLPSAAGWGFASSSSTQRHLQGDDVAAPCGQAASPDCFLGHRSRQLNPGDRQQPLPDPAAVPKRPDLALSWLLLCSK